MTEISVIVPTLDEASVIERTLRGILERRDEAEIEVMVADGGSQDHTVTTAVLSPPLPRRSLRRRSTHASCNIQLWGGTHDRVVGHARARCVPAAPVPGAPHGCILC